MPSSSEEKPAAVIMVVDDDNAVRDVVSLLLQGKAYQTVACQSAFEAIDALKAAEVDVVISDIKMPGMTGIDLLDRIRSDRPDLPVILMTGYADLDSAVSAVKKGAFDFIIKPYKADYLLHAVEKAIRFRQLIQLEQGYRKTLEEFNAEIEALIAERTMNLMALTMADKVRNPAFVISCQTKRLLAASDMPEKFRSALAEMGEEAAHLEQIVEGFQSVLKRRESFYAYEDIGAVLAEAIALAEKDAALKRVTFSVTAQASPLRLNMQKNLLRIAFLNLLRNAIEASGIGGVVSVETRSDKDFVLVGINDNGCGIPADMRERIFDPFFSTKAHGFGMGLPLVKQIVTEHMGEIQVQSSEGGGTRFTLRFPLRWKQPQQEAPSCGV
jgi:signal transduction histidine kinase